MDKNQVLIAGQTIRLRNQLAGRLVRGYNDCFALGVEVFKIKHGQTNSFDWVPTDFKRNRDFYIALSKRYGASTPYQALLMMIEEVGGTEVKNGLLRTGDIIIRQVGYNLSVSVVLDTEFELTVLLDEERNKGEVIQKPRNDIYDDHIVIIGRP